MNQTSPSLAQFNSEIVQRFPGLQKRLHEFSEHSSDFPEEVTDDMDGEQETLGVREKINAPNGSMEEEESLDVAQEDVRVFVGAMSSSQPMAPGYGDYQRYSDELFPSCILLIQSRLMNQCEAFLIAHGLIKKRGDFFHNDPPRNAADMIVVWIMDSLVLDSEIYINVTKVLQM